MNIVPTWQASSKEAAVQKVAVKGISKAYSGVVALESTDLSISAGEFVTLLGPSGSGKTTLLNIISGMVPATEGSIVINGRDVTRVAPERRNIGMVFQNYALMPHMTIFQNIAFPLKIRRWARADIKRRVGEVLQLVQLPDVANRKPNELSGGQQQRISIARCLAYRPEIILMDEPLGALDKALRDRMQYEIKKINVETGITIIYVTHDQDEAMNMSDRIVIMNKGRIEQVGSPREIYDLPVSEFAASFIGKISFLEVAAAREGSTSVLRLGNGVPIKFGGVRRGDGRPTKLALRTEMLKVSRHEVSPDEHSNVLPATVEDCVTSAGVTQFRLGLETGEQVISTELGSVKIPAGSKVWVKWESSLGILF